MFKLIKYQLYLLQLENYELSRYFKLILAGGIWPPKNQRGQLSWTLKAILILLFSIICHFVLAVSLAWYVYILFGWVAAGEFFALIFVVASLFYFIFYSLTVLIIWPFHLLVKIRLMAKAKQKLKTMPELKVIAIAGSYGKTTMKATLAMVLAEKYIISATPDSINTPLGIAQFILKQTDPKTQILILEMGEHYQGDIRELCEFIKPDIGVITGINESHLERMGNLKTIVATVFELAAEIKTGGLIVLNADDKNVSSNFKNYCDNLKIKFYSSLNDPLSYFKIDNYSFNETELVNNFELKSISESAQVKSRILGEYIKQFATAAATVGAELKLDLKTVSQGLNKLQPIDHRLQPTINARGVLIIDDGYNGNPDGVREAIALLSKFKDRRKVYITPGLVETGSSVKEVHIKIGQQLAVVADLVILIKNSVTPFIAEGLSQAGYDQSKIIWFETAPSAHQALGNILKPNDVILFQNDWGDQYI